MLALFLFIGLTSFADILTICSELSDRLGMSREEGERWIVDLVRDAKLDAKIDFKEVTYIF